MTEGAQAREIPWWERHPKVFLGELAQIRRAKFRPAIVTRRTDDGWEGELLVATGRIRVKAARPGDAEGWHAVSVEVTYPAGYPFDKLAVVPVDPLIRRKRHQSRLSGDVCYMQEELEAWSLGYGIERAVEGTRAWLKGIVIGRFENEVPGAEFLSYFESDCDYVRALLLPKQAHWANPPGRRGTFALEWDRHRRGVCFFTARDKKPGAPLPKTVREEQDGLWLAVRGPKEAEEVTGIWFALDSEPPPFSNLHELEEILASNGRVSREVFHESAVRVLDSRARQRGWVPVGLSYPGREQGGDQPSPREWVFASLQWPKYPKNLQKANRLRTMFWNYVEVRGIPSYSVNRPDLVRRVGSLYPTDSLKDEHVVVVGVGALGATVARSLVAAGIGRITIVDHDVVKPGNVVRHEARLPDVGVLKVVALEQILRETNPYAEVTTVPGTRAGRKKFESCLLSRQRRPSLVIATVAQKAVDGQIDDLARRADRPMPVLHAWVMGQAQVLRAFVHRPGTTACTWCYGPYEADKLGGNDSGYIPGPANVGGPFFEGGCGDPSFPGAGNANALCAHLIAEMALDVLHGRLKQDESHWVFAGNRIREADPEFPLPPLSIVRKGFSPHPRCPVCGEQLTSDELTEDERGALERETASLRGHG